MEEQMSSEQTAFLTFVRTGAFGVIHPEMDVDTVNALLPGCDYRVDLPYTFLVGTHAEVTFEHQRIIQVRVRFMVYEPDPWMTEVIPWFDWLQTATMEDIEQLLQEQQLGYQHIHFTDDSYVIELSHLPIRLAYDTPQQIFALFRRYDGLRPWHPDLVIETKTFTPRDAEDNQETLS